MSKITTREQFAELCLQKLGKPVIPINVSPEQIDICITDALKFWQEYHFDGTLRTYMKRQVGASIVTLSTNTANSFTFGEKLLSSISNTTVTIFDIIGQNVLALEEYSLSLQVGETLTGQISGATAVISNIATQNDKTNRYVTVPDRITSVTRLLNFAQKTTDISMFDIRYQIRLNDLYSMVDSSMVYYTQVKQQLELMDQILIGQKGIRFNRVMNKCFVDMDWDTDVENGDWLIFDAYVTVNPDEYTDAYNDRILQKLGVAYIKRQWGQNLSLYGEIALPGGIRLNADKILMDAERDVELLEQEFQDRYELPNPFYLY